MRYFIINGYLPSPHPPKHSEGGYSTVNFAHLRDVTREDMLRLYKDAGVDPPDFGEQVVLRTEGFGRISVFVYGLYQALFLVVAGSQRKAYLLAGALRATMTCFGGQDAANMGFGSLLELVNRPTGEISHLDLARLIAPPSEENPAADIEIANELNTGTRIDQYQLKYACRIASKVFDHLPHLDALMHLEYSRTLVCGFMVDSYYDAHYRHDRKAFSCYHLEGRYLENRFRYDSAFVSAFRGIECVLGKCGLKKRGISRLLSDTDKKFGSTFSTGKYRAWHEVFSTRRKHWTYERIIAHYLDLRNAVSAHGNPSPPKIVMEDQVFEIQLLLQTMLVNVLGLKDSD